MNINFSEENIKKLDGKGKLKKVGIVGLCLTMLLSLAGCNRSVYDVRRGFDKALITGNDTAIVMDIREWGDYPGEQLQLTSEDKFTVLTSSFDTDQFFGKSDNYNIFDIANNSVSNGEDVYTIGLDDDDTVLYNRDIWDLQYKYNKAFIYNGNRGLILPVVGWKDYQGEQF